MAFAYPLFEKYDLGVVRLLGPGLGNLLFPWARAVVACDRDGLTLIDPTWPSIKVGPLLRGEADLRFYGSLFRPAPHSVSGLRKLMLLLGSRRVSEERYVSVYEAGGSLPKRTVVLFRGMRDFFRDIRGSHELLARSLHGIVRDQAGIRTSLDGEPAIAVHVRRGDFKVVGRATPLGWYVGAVETLRGALGATVPVSVFSDGSDNELQELLQLPECRRESYGSSIGDMLALSRALILVGSANSTFSMWASYLGQMPTLWTPGHRARGEGECSQSPHVLYAGGELEPTFVRACKRQWAKRLDLSHC